MSPRTPTCREHHGDVMRELFRCCQSEQNLARDNGLWLETRLVCCKVSISKPTLWYKSSKAHQEPERSTVSPVGWHQRSETKFMLLRDPWCVMHVRCTLTGVAQLDVVAELCAVSLFLLGASRRTCKQIKGYDVKGAQFFRFTTPLTEDITSLAVAGSSLFTFTSSSVTIFEETQERCTYTAPEAITSSAVAPLLSAETWWALIGCNDRSIKVLNNDKVAQVLPSRLHCCRTSHPASNTSTSR